jgi:integrase
MARTHLDLFMRWLRENGGAFKGYSPDQLVEYQRNADNSHRYDVLDLVQRHVLSVKGRRNSKNSRYTYLRSFFMHNRAELPRDRSFRVRGDEPRVRGDLTLEEARKLILSMNPMFQAVYLCMFQGGMGSHELLYWSDHGLEKLKEDLRGDPDIIKVDLPGRKEGEYERPFYTFLGGDAVAALKKWMAQRPEDSKAIFVTQMGAPLNYFSIQANWRRRMRKLGIGPRNLGRRRGRTGKSPHELRDLFRSQWAKSPAKPEVAEFLMGHMIDPLEYNKSFRDVGFYRKEYLKALPYLQIMSSPRPFGQVSEEEVESLRAEVERLRAGRDTQIEELRRGLEELRKMIIDLMK